MTKDKNGKCLIKQNKMYESCNVPTVNDIFRSVYNEDYYD